MPVTVAVVAGEAIGRYGFGNGHPFGSDRQECFVRELASQGLAGEVLHHPPRTATRDELISFHTPTYVDFVQQKSVSGEGFLDGGDTPAFRGVFEAASAVVGATLVAVESLMSGASRRAFVPIAGLHHAARDRAAGFCVFNDCGVAVEQLRSRHGIQRIAYVGICTRVPARRRKPAKAPPAAPSSTCRCRRARAMLSS
jgi:acetoin utilization protein AcuC